MDKLPATRCRRRDAYVDDDDKAGAEVVRDGVRRAFCSKRTLIRSAQAAAEDTRSETVSNAWSTWSMRPVSPSMVDQELGILAERGVRGLKLRNDGRQDRRREGGVACRYG